MTLRARWSRTEQISAAAHLPPTTYVTMSEQMWIEQHRRRAALEAGEVLQHFVEVFPHLAIESIRAQGLREGYPRCCVEFYAVCIQLLWDRVPDAQRYWAGSNCGYGYVPCPQCLRLAPVVGVHRPADVADVQGDLFGMRGRPGQISGTYDRGPHGPIFLSRATLEE